VAALTMQVFIIALCIFIPPAHAILVRYN
jgi:hypothetical protein